MQTTAKIPLHFPKPLRAVNFLKLVTKLRSSVIFTKINDIHTFLHNDGLWKLSRFEYVTKSFGRTISSSNLVQLLFFQFAYKSNAFDVFRSIFFAFDVFRANQSISINQRKAPILIAQYSQAIHKWCFNHIYQWVVQSTHPAINWGLAFFRNIKGTECNRIQHLNLSLSDEHIFLIFPTHHWL